MGKLTHMPISETQTPEQALHQALKSADEFETVLIIGQTKDKRFFSYTSKTIRQEYLWILKVAEIELMDC